MKLHLPIGLRKALMAVFAVLAVSPAMADDTVITTNQSSTNGLSMSGDSNKIASQDSAIEKGISIPFVGSWWEVEKNLPGFIAGSTNPNVTVSSGDITMSTTSGYNAIVGSVIGDYEFNLGIGYRLIAHGGRPTIIAENGDVLMEGPANAVMLGSTVKGTNITLKNTTEDKTITVGKVTDGILGDFGARFIPDSMKGMEGIFNIVQGSKLEATESVTLNTTTDSSVNTLKVNVIAGGRGDITDVVSDFLSDELGDGLGNIAGYVINGITQDNVGSTIKAGTDITMGGGASVIVDTTLSDLVDFAKAEDTMTGLQSLLAGNSSNKTKVELTAGNNLNLNSIINMAYAAQGGVTLTAGTADGVVGAINATGALNVIGGKTTLTADNINLTPGTSVSINKLVSELKQLGDFMTVDLSSITGKLGALADQNVNASIVAGGANLKATALTDVAEGKDAGGDISLSGTAGIVVNTKVTDVLGALGDLQAGHVMLFAQKVLESSAETSLTASRDINVGAQLNVLHGGFAKDDATQEIVIGKNTLTITAGNDVTLHGAANLVSGNVQVNAGSRDAEGKITHKGDIHMHGEFLDGALATAVGSFANGFVKDMGINNAGVSNIIGQLTEKGNFNVVTGGATLEATGDIKLDSELDTEFKQASAINAVLDTQFTDVITAVINGEPSAILPTNKDVFKPTTTLTAGGDIDLLGRVNVVNGLRGNVVVDADGDVNLQGNISMVSGNSTVTGNNITINTVEGDTYKMHLNAQEVKDMLGVSDGIANAIQNMGMMNAAVVAGGAKLEAEGNITTGGTVGLLMNTPVADVLTEFMSLGKDDSMLDIAASLLQKGEATTLTATNGNINVGSQFNLLHGGGFTDVEGDNALVLNATNLTYNEKGEAVTGLVNIEGTANVVSGNVKVNAGEITMTGEVLPADMAKAANGLVGSLTEDMGISGVSGVLNKLVNKGSVNMVTGGATLTATAVKNAEGEMVGGDITMTGKSVDDVGKIGNINAVIDTEMVDVLDAYINNNTDALVHGGGHMTTLQADGNINLEGRVNVVNGKYVTLDADKDINLQGNLSMIGGATVNADGNININTDEAEKYKMYLDAEELGALLPSSVTIPDALDGVVENTGVNAAVIAGGAKLEADGNITTGGTASILVNTPLSEVMNELVSYSKHEQEVYLIDQLLRPGIATTLTSNTGNIELGSQFNVLHGGNMGNADAALKLSAANGAVKLNGTLNMVSGNVKMDAESINMTGEALKYNLGDGLADMTGAEVLDKLNTYGSANVVTGGATLTAKGEEGITMKGLANAVLDVELVDATEAFMERPDMSALMQGGAYETTLNATTGDINLLGRFNVVNGGKVSLLADNGDVNVNGGVSFIGGGATVKANNIKLNDDETGKYQMYFDSTELGAILPAGSPITEMLNTFGVTDLLGKTGVNGAIVAGGANLTATGDITTGGTVSMLVNTPLSEVMKELQDWTKHEQETWMAYQLLQKGAATSVHANGNINLASRLNVLHGGNFGKDGANALSLTAGKDVKMSGSANVVSGNVIVNAGSRDAEGNITHKGDILMKGEPLKFDMESGVEMLDKLAAKGSTNIVTGGATLKATGNIKLDSMANFVLDTEATDLVETFMERNLDAVAQGGNKLTSLNAGGNIDLVGRLNVVNGAYVALNADKDVNISGTLNMVSGKAKVNGNNINITGQTSVGLDWGEIIPGVVGDYVDGTGLTDKLNKGVNGSMILGGSTLTATNDIKMSGMAGVVTNVPLGSAFEALNTKLEQTWQPELWLMKDMLNDGIATSLTAGNNIELTSRLNLLHGGNMGNADAALKLTAGKEVIIAGTANIISGNTQVTAGEGIKITGKTGVGFDWDKVVDAMPDKYDGYGALAGQMGILAKLEKGVNGSVIAGGATLTATNGDITMEGMATAVVDVTAENVLTAVETMNGTPIMEGGAADTLIKAENGSINLNSRLNLVNGGKVTLDAGQNVNMNGTFNTVSGNATVKAGANIEMNAQNKVGVDISPVLDGHYAEIAKDLGMADVLKNGVSSNIVAGGASLQAEGDVKMSGVATAIVDTTASNVIGAVKGENLGELMKGGKSTTEVKAKGNIELASQMNVVNGGNTKNAGGVLLDAGKDVIVGGQVSVINRAEIKAGQNVNFNSGNTVVKYSDIAAGKVAFTGKTAEITDVKFNNASVDVLNAHLVNTLRSEVAMNNLNVADMGSIENLGTLSLKDATLSGATLYNAGSIIVSNTMTLDSATLSFVADENNVTLNHTAIVLDDGFQTLVDRSGDMLAGLHFELNYGALEFVNDSNVFEFRLDIFENITKELTDKLAADLADGEFSITLTNGFRVDDYTNVEIKWDSSNNVAYVKGTASVPEPTTATLSLLALAALAARRRRR